MHQQYDEATRGTEVVYGLERVRAERMFSRLPQPGKSQVSAGAQLKRRDVYLGCNSLLPIQAALTSLGYQDRSYRTSRSL